MFPLQKETFCTFLRATVAWNPSRMKVFDSTLHGLQMWWRKTFISPNHRPSPLWLAEHLSSNVMPDKLQEFAVFLKITHLKKIHNNVYTQLKGEKLLDNTTSVKKKDFSWISHSCCFTTVPRPKQSLSKGHQLYRKSAFTLLYHLQQERKKNTDMSK